MAKVQLRKTFKAPIEKVVEYFGNPELHLGSSGDPGASCKVISRKENELVIEDERDAGQRRLKTTQRIRLHLPHRVETEIIDGLAKGSKSVTSFEVDPEGTRVTYTTDLKFGGMAGRVLGRLGKPLLKKMMEEEMEAAAEKARKYLEGEQ
ncbi:MAG: SRPBCC family protein [Chloroflexi bacterium]|nr:SRPBCC family protein [Chloroflexota bacterium]